jgi:hypothetical protein
MRQQLVLIALILFIAGISFILSAQDQQGGRPLTIPLTGAAEVPGPGDTDGTGTAKITLNPGPSKVCFELTVDKIATPNGAHIHSGAAGEAGPVVVTLTAPTNGSSKDCVTLEREKIMDIVKNPGSYYVNVHNAEFPKGAVRGQLSK